MTERIEVSRPIDATPEAVFSLLCDPLGHVAIDSSGMLQSAAGEKVSAVGDSFVVHMDRESLGDFDMGLYDVTVTISAHEQDREIAWKVLGRARPQIGHVYGYRIEPAERGAGHVVLRLVGHRAGVARGRHLPGDLRGRTQGDTGDSSTARCGAGTPTASDQGPTPSQL